MIENEDQNETENEGQTCSSDERLVGRDIVAEEELGSDAILEKTLLYAFDQSVEMLEQSGGFEPFVVIIKGEELFIEELSVEDEEEALAAAQKTVFQMEKLSDAYLFCYDGYVELDEGEHDAIIIEYASKDDDVAQIIVQLYHYHDEDLHFDEDLYHIGEAESFFGKETLEVQAEDISSVAVNEEGAVDRPAGRFTSTGESVDVDSEPEA